MGADERLATGSVGRSTDAAEVCGRRAVARLSLTTLDRLEVERAAGIAEQCSRTTWRASTIAGCTECAGDLGVAGFPLARNPNGPVGGAASRSELQEQRRGDLAAATGKRSRHHLCRRQHLQ